MVINCLLNHSTPFLIRIGKKGEREKKSIEVGEEKKVGYMKIRRGGKGGRGNGI